MATFWNVLDRPTAAMIARFYALHLEGDGLPPATALRQAVLGLREAGEMAAADRQLRRHPTIGEAPEQDIAGSAETSKLPPEGPPDLHGLFARPWSGPPTRAGSGAV